MCARASVPGISPPSRIGHTRQIRRLDHPDYAQSLDPNADHSFRAALEGDDELPDALGDTAVILGVSWKTNEPQLRVRYGSEPKSSFEPLIGQSLHYRTTGKRICLGHSPFRNPAVDYIDCQRPPVKGSRRCDRCNASEATFAASLHHAHTRELSMIDPAVRDHLQQANRLYLAGFRDGSIKVGTSTLDRTDQRLAEQGAWRAELVAEATDGVAVRQLEDLVTEVLGIAQSVSVSRKLDGMTVVSASEAAERDVALSAVLTSSASKVRQLVDHAGDPRLEALAETWEPVSRHHEIWNKTHRYPHALDDGAHQLDVVDAVGRVVALKRTGAGASGDTFVADIGRLYGVQMELGDHGSAEIAVQDSLF